MSASRSGAEEAGPVRPDVAQLAGQRGGGAAGGRPHQLDQREAAVLHRRAVGEGPLEPLDRVAIAGPLDEGRVVDQLLEQRPDRRVLVRDPGQQQLLEPMEGRLGRRSRPRELLAEPVEQAARVGSETRLEVRHGRLHRARPAVAS